jgi:VWFA-related protein
VRVESSDRPSTIRAAATLDDGQVAEDFRFVNAPAYLEEVEVERVELFVSATDKGRLVSGLEAKDFRLLVGGKPVAIDGFEVVHQLPLQVVLALDTSESMRESLPETEKAAAGFLRGVLRPQDRAALVRFDDEPRIVQRFTGERPRLESALASLTAERGTALWDATVYSLFQFQGKKGRRALVLLSDGKDVDSRFSYADALDYAKRSGATIYTVALAIPKTSIDVRSKLSELATETGGRSYFIEKASELEGTYARIDEELRTQYRISFAPPGEKDSRWHKVVVELPNRSGVEVRAASGYYR